MTIKDIKAHYEEMSKTLKACQETTERLKACQATTERLKDQLAASNSTQSKNQASAAAPKAPKDLDF
jgi:hypothetical protein